MFACFSFLDVFSKGVFCFDKILWASYLAVHAHELSVLLHYAHSGLTHNRKEIFAMVFFFLCLAVKRSGTACGRSGLGRYPRLRLTSSLLRCVPGEARQRGGLRRSQNAEKLQAWAEARAAVSLIGLLAV